MSFELRKKHWYYVPDNIMVEIYKAFESKSLDELKKKIEIGFKASVNDEKSKKIRLLNLKLSLECWKLMKEQGYTISQATEILSGSKDLLEPQLILLQMSKNNKNGICDYCGHAHADSQPYVCKELSCNCGLR